MRRLFALLAIVLVACTARVASTPPGSAPIAARASGDSSEAAASRRPIVLAFAGDVIAHEAVRESARRGGYGAMLSGARAWLRDADLAFVNVESPITEHSMRRGDMIFRGDAAMVSAIADAGVDVISFANNHAYDQGPRGVSDTLAAAQRHGLVVAGAGSSAREACAPVKIDVRGIAVSLFARTQYMNFKGDESPSRVCMLDVGALKRAARAAREAGADLVVASLHWGNEYEAAPRREQIDVAHMIVEAGVDLLIGHHPHVLQRVERRSVKGRDALIAYSLGNLLSNQGYDYDRARAPERDGDTRDAAILRVVVEKTGEEGGMGGVRLRDVSAVPLWTEHVDETIVLVPATTRRARIARRLAVPLCDAPK